ncbi:MULTISPECIES: hypothetical protein [Sphingomonas]|uniref:hypothetical protein n=1 Tax=Sphingomonas TaxID=13687 RepID=UPI0006FFE337|nr:MULTISPECIES: hypothetical protein [Sphingomonas]KQM91895.1 hypothetical protein ASE77_11945 [Sphingomonas sp. Leaf226]MDY0966918.1 hypothetical protein [Sphingomonas sp. CFBP9021]USQ98910.1 hypothetical protein NEF64_10540 [Sphingomonas aerolata]
MTWNLFMYGAGWACLGVIAIIAAVIFVDDLYHRWPQIMTALRGNDRPGFVPLSPTTSVRPLRTSVPLLRSVEAGAQPTYLAVHGG